MTNNKNTKKSSTEIKKVEEVSNPNLSTRELLLNDIPKVESTEFDYKDRKLFCRQLTIKEDLEIRELATDVYPKGNEKYPDGNEIINEDKYAIWRILRSVYDETNTKRIFEDTDFDAIFNGANIKSWIAEFTFIARVAGFIDKEKLKNALSGLEN